MNTVKKEITATVIAWVAASGLVSAHAEVALQIEDGFLVGATGVEVGGSLYDVRFVDGTCAAAFGECTKAKLNFQSQAEATAASQALLDQVFAPSFAYYDDHPDRIRGCGFMGHCLILNSFDVYDHPTYGVPYVAFMAAFNADPVETSAGGNPDYVAGVSNYQGDYDWTLSNEAVLAVWSPSTLASLEITPKTTDFGLVVVNGSNTRSINLANKGANAVRVTSVGSADPLAPPFKLTQDRCTGVSLAPGQSCVFRVNFSPTSLGEYMDSFNVYTTDPIVQSLRSTVRGIAVALGGQVLGLRRMSVTCENKSRKASITFAISSEEVGAWDCQVAGLPVKSGDEIAMKVKGIAE